MQNLNNKPREQSDAWRMIELLGQQNKRMFVALLVVLALWAATIAGFIWYLYQYDFESYSYTQDGEGLNVIGDSNEVTDYGANTGDTQENP